MEARRLLEESKKKKDPEEALKLLSEAVLVNPPDASLYLARAEVLVTRQQAVEALDEAQLCVTLDPTCVPGWLVKGRAERLLGRSGDAALSFQAGLNLEPNHEELSAEMQSVKDETVPGVLKQLWDLVFAARLGLENLFRTVEDPEKTTDAYVVANCDLLNAQMGLLAQMLRVNMAVLQESPRLMDAYEQILNACAHLISGAPAAFSTHMVNASNIIEGMSLALRIGWHVHHSVPKMAANALIALAICPGAKDEHRRAAVRHLLGGLRRWLLDARPERMEVVDEVCGCSCSVPWKAAACFVERLFEPGRIQPWVREEIESYTDIAEFCQWLTLSVRDYHATPLGLVGLLQLPAVAAAVMRSRAMVDFFVAAHLVEARQKDAETPPEKAEGEDRSPTMEVLEELSNKLQGFTLMLRRRTGIGWERAELATSGVEFAPRPPAIAPPAQRLGEWLMASIAYLFLFIEGDTLFLVYACRAFQNMMAADPDGDGVGRFTRGVWLGIPFLTKLSYVACSNTAALDLLHTLLQGDHRGVRTATLSLARSLARPGPLPSSESRVDLPIQPPEIEQDGPSLSASSGSSAEETEVDLAAAIEQRHQEEVVPSWADFHQELLNDLSSPPVLQGDLPEMVTLANFEDKGRALARHSVMRTLRAALKKVDGSPEVCLECSAVPAVWNRSLEEPWAQGLKDLLPVHVQEAKAEVGCGAYVSDPLKQGKVVLMSRLSIRTSPFVTNWAQAVTAAAKGGALAAVIFNNLDAMEPFRMGLFGESPPSIPAFMVSGSDGIALQQAAANGCFLQIADLSDELEMEQIPWPLTGGRLPPDVAQAWSLLEALDTHGEAGVREEMEGLLQQMSVPEKRVWLTRRLVRYHRQQQALAEGMSRRGQSEAASSSHSPRSSYDLPDFDSLLAELPLAFVEADRALLPRAQLDALRRQLCEETGIGSPDICGDFEVRFLGEQGVGSAVVREWIDLVAREVFIAPVNRLLCSYDRRQSFWPDPAALFCNPQWKMDYEALGRLLGLALWQSCTLDLPLHPHVCGLLFGFSREELDTTLANADEEVAKGKVKWLLENPLDSLGFVLPFADPLGQDEELKAASGDKKEELVEPLPEFVDASHQLPGTERSFPGKPVRAVGASAMLLSDTATPSSSSSARPPTVVTEENKAVYAKSLEEWRLYEGIIRQVDAARVGLHMVVPPELCAELRALLSPAEICGLLSGMGGPPNLEDWEMHTAYAGGLRRDSDVVAWFWKVVQAWAHSEDPAEQAMLPQLLQFVTGSGRVPVGGFSELVGFNGAKHPFTLSNGSHLRPEALPMAHACICTLDLPPYTDFETCQRKMQQMLQLGRSHFDEGAGRPDGN